MEQGSFAANPSLTSALARRSQPISCIESHILFKQGEQPRGVFILQSGEAVLIMKSDAGNVVMCLRAHSGALLGLPAILGGNQYSLSAMVRPGAVVRLVTRSDFEDMVQAEPVLYPMALEILASEVRTARRALSGA